MNPTDLTAISQIASSLSLTAFLLYVWNNERQERKEAQKKLVETLEKLANHEKAPE